MALHFIADLHLDPDQPEITRRFVAYLEGPARDAQALYILGDLFEVWADDDVSLPRYPEAISALRALSDSGVPIHFLHGNRDFLCGVRFARAAGLTLLDEPHRTAPSLLLMHGDALCTDDAGYQRFRRIVRWRWLQAVFRALPGRLKLRIARAIRGQTRRMTRLKPEDILDVNETAVSELMGQHPECRLLIHGHTHRPADHALGKDRWRLVLADWSPESGEYLSLDGSSWQRHRL